MTVGELVARLQALPQTALMHYAETPIASVLYFSNGLVGAALAMYTFVLYIYKKRQERRQV